jgi:TolB-like protein
MRRSLVLTTILGAMLAVGPATAQGTTIAVLPFEDGGSYGQDKAGFEALRTSLQSSLVGELSRASGATVVARGEAGARVDAAAAVRTGKEAGARYVVFGNFIDHYGRFRLNARIVDTESGEIVRVVSNDDAALQDRKDLPRIVQAVAAGIVEATKLPARPASS